MLSTTDYNRGDVVLVDFVYSDESGLKRRPVLLLTSDSYHSGRQEAISVAITSNTARLLVGDTLMFDLQAAGLIDPSVVTGILRTIKQAMIGSKLGTISHGDLAAVEVQVRRILGLAT